jgi:hypothetical protein
LIQTLLLLFSVLSDHLVFKGFHLLLSIDKSSLFVHGKDHVRLGLLHLQVLNTGHFPVFVNHTLDYIVDLLFFFKVLVAGFYFQLLALNDLLLYVLFVVDAVLKVALVSLSLDLVLDLFGP